MWLQEQIGKTTTLKMHYKLLCDIKTRMTRYVSFIINYQANIGMYLYHCCARVKSINAPIFSTCYFIDKNLAIHKAYTTPAKCLCAEQCRFWYYGQWSRVRVWVQTKQHHIDRWQRRQCQQSTSNVVVFKAS